MTKTIIIIFNGYPLLEGHPVAKEVVGEAIVLNPIILKDNGTIDYKKTYKTLLNGVYGLSDDMPDKIIIYGQEKFVQICQEYLKLKTPMDEDFTNPEWFDWWTSRNKLYSDVMMPLTMKCNNVVFINRSSKLPNCKEIIKTATIKLGLLRPEDQRRCNGCGDDLVMMHMKCTPTTCNLYPK